MRIGLFELQDGVTPERVERFRQTLDLIDYPWARLMPALLNDPDQAVVVRWDATKQGTTGLFFGNRIEIHLSELDRDAAQEPFVTAHEIGHLVDHATLHLVHRNQISDLLHTVKPQLGHFDHDHPDAGHTRESWKNGREPYPARISEAFADMFVRSFAPSLWEGRHPRFVHWSDDLEAFRQIVLSREIHVYTDVQSDNPHKDAIEEAAVLGLMVGVGDGKFDPKRAVTREEAATIAVRTYRLAHAN